MNITNHGETIATMLPLLSEVQETVSNLQENTTMLDGESFMMEKRLTSLEELVTGICPTLISTASFYEIFNCFLTT